MRTSKFFIWTASCLIGGIGTIGCTNENQSGFAGGNGAFGESPEYPGAYGPAPRTDHASVANNHGGFQGGNGSFGESPQSPGK